MNKYDKLEKKYINGWLKLVKKKGYHSSLKINEIQEMIQLLAYYYSNELIDADMTDDMKQLYFNRIISEIPKEMSCLLIGQYRCSDWLPQETKNADGSKKITIYPYVPVRCLESNANTPIKMIKLDAIVFNEDDGEIIMSPSSFGIKEGTTIDEFYNENKSSNKYDLTIMLDLLRIHNTDMQLRDIIIESAALRLIAQSNNDQTLDHSYRRAVTLVDSMEVNIGNFDGSSMLERMHETYISSREEELDDELKMTLKNE